MTGIRQGVVYLFFGWLFQLFAGYVLNIGLARTLGPEGYGLYGVVMSILLWIELGAISGFPTAIQKFIPGQESRAHDILTRAAQLQFLMILGLFGLAFASAPWIGKVLKDDRIGSLLRIALIDIWVYGYFFLYLGLQNGFRRFGHQAILIGFYSGAKLLAVIVLVAWTKSVTGALLGNIVGSTLALILGIIVSRRTVSPKAITPFPTRALVTFTAPVTLYVLIVNLLLNVDLWMTKLYLGTVVSAQYVSASLFARVPYYLFLGLSAAMLPALSSVLAKKDEERARRMIQTAYRFILIVALPLSILTLAYADEIVILFFGMPYAGAAPILKMLIWGMALLSVFILSTTVINADNRPSVSLWLSGAIASLDVLLNIVLVPALGAFGAALSTTLALLVGSAVAAGLVYRRFRVFVGWRSVCRLVPVSALLFGVSCLVRVDGLAILPAGGGMLIGYGLVLLVLKEIRLEDFRFRSS